MSYVKIIQIVFESILTTTLFFTLSASKCSTIHKIMFTTTFTIVYTFCFVRLRSIPTVSYTHLNDHRRLFTGVLAGRVKAGSGAAC